MVPGLEMFIRLVFDGIFPDLINGINGINGPDSIDFFAECSPKPASGGLVNVQV